MKKTLTTVYGALALLATGLAAFIAVLFLLALALGGAAGGAISEFAGTVARWSISVAAVAVLVGLVHTYVTGTHSLTAGPSRKSGTEES
ncbi:hypothetical protein E0L36_12500 [Streptomyces sp. AJS327]|uniref:hypothetical protein n=1 Tax=Streptomyces sp. AJS327 TaxID=2545265 RepID=UPI0015DEA1D0|nr:hypothetical protein [Streptomyces sp. AJS327]MBA0051687.1 hypothetical protein [Streptomyces sp. AJS327]